MKNSEKFDLRKFLKENKIKTGLYKTKDLIIESKNPYNDTQKNVIKEGISDYHSVEYYALVGEHGDVGSYSNFKQAIKKAEVLKKEELKRDTLGSDTAYIGVSGNTDDFAIIYIDQPYFKRISSNDFSDSKSYNNWLKIAKKAFKSEKTEIGKY